MNASGITNEGDILDEDEIVSVDLPEILEGARPASKLIVRIVLCHHYSIAIPGTRKPIKTNTNSSSIQQLKFELFKSSNDCIEKSNHISIFTIEPEMLKLT